MQPLGSRLRIMSVQRAVEGPSVGGRLAFSFVFTQQLTRVWPEMKSCADSTANYSKDGDKERQLNAPSDGSYRR